MTTLPAAELTTDQTVLREVVRAAYDDAVEGGLPFVAKILLAPGLHTGMTVNRVHTTSDPTAHAEVEAIRDATRWHGAAALRGAVLYTSCSPCILCYVTAFYAGIGRIVCAVTREEAGRYGCDLRGTYKRFPRDDGEGWGPAVEFLDVPDRLLPFQTWSGLS